MHYIHKTTLVVGIFWIDSCSDFLHKFCGDSFQSHTELLLETSLCKCGSCPIAYTTDPCKPRNLRCFCSSRLFSKEKWSARILLTIKTRKKDFSSFNLQNNLPLNVLKRDAGFTFLSRNTSFSPSKTNGKKHILPQNPRYLWSLSWILEELLNTNHPSILKCTKTCFDQMHTIC